MNRFEIIGNLGQPPEVRQLPSGQAVATLNVASNRKYREKEGGELVDVTTWLRVTLFGKPAENAGKYLGKGSKVFIAGRMENDSYEKDGVTIHTMNFIGQEIEYLSPAKDGGPAPENE